MGPKRPHKRKDPAYQNVGSLCSCGLLAPILWTRPTARDAPKRQSDAHSVQRGRPPGCSHERGVVALGCGVDDTPPTRQAVLDFFFNVLLVAFTVYRRPQTLQFLKGVQEELSPYHAQNEPDKAVLGLPVVGGSTCRDLSSPGLDGLPSREMELSRSRSDHQDAVKESRLGVQIVDCEVSWQFQRKCGNFS